MSAEAVPPFTAVILAAQRAGTLDPLAAEAGVTHKCLVPIVGRPLIQYVLEALAPSRGLRKIRICIEPEAVEAVQAVIDRSQGLDIPIDFVPSRETITDSAYASAEGVEGPILFTTADNVNLTAEAVERMMAPLAQGSDGTLGLASREAVLVARSEEKLPPESVANVGPYRFADGAFSNCNLYALAGAHVLKMAEAFREGGQFSKKPRRLIGFVGIVNIVLFLFRLLTLEQAMRRLSRRFGVKVAAVVLEDGSQAIDVDNPRTYRIAEAILRRKAATGGLPASA